MKKQVGIFQNIPQVKAPGGWGPDLFFISVDDLKPVFFPLFFRQLFRGAGMGRVDEADEPAGRRFVKIPDQPDDKNRDEKR